MTPAQVESVRAHAQMLIDKDEEIARLKGQIAQIRNVIPINFLRACDAPGATGPTDSLDLVAAVRLLVSKGRDLEEKLRNQR